MADANALTYKQIQDDVLQNRFPEASRGLATRWIAVAYQQVWAAAEWTFKRVSRGTFYTTSNGLVGGTASNSPLMPAAFDSINTLYDDNGDVLDQLDQDDFEAYYTPVTSTGRPEAFMVVDRQIVLGPTPTQGYLFKLSYRRRMAHKNTGGTVVAGFFTADTDYPLWDDYHRILVPRAQITGLREKNDPTWPALQEEYNDLLASMKRDYLAKTMPRQWPAYRL